MSLPPDEDADACSKAITKMYQNNLYVCYEITTEEHKAIKDKIEQLENYQKHIEPALETLQDLCKDVKDLLNDVASAEAEELAGIGKRKREEDLIDLEDAAEEILILVKKVRVESRRMMSPGKDGDSAITAVRSSASIM